MLKRCLLLLGLLGLAALPAPVRAVDDTAAGPTVTIQVRSLDGLVADFKYLAGLVGQEANGKKLDEGLKQFANGIDTKKPLGVLGTLDPSLIDSKAVILIPVADEKAFVTLVENLTKQSPKKEDNGAYIFSVENFPFPVYFRIANGYAYATVKDASVIDPAKLPKPEQALRGAESSTAAVSFRLDRIPDGINQLAVLQIESRLAALEDEKVAGETPAQKTVRVEAVRQLSKDLTMFLRDARELALRFNIDRAGKELTAELTLSAKPGSELARRYAGLGKTQSLFAGLLKPDAAVNLVVHGGLPEPIKKVIGPAIDDEVKKQLDKEKNQIQRAVAEKVAAALKPTLKAGELDLAFSLRGPGAAKHYTMLMGVRLAEGESIESVARDLVQMAPEKDRPKVKLDVATVGDVKIHQLDVKDTLDPEARKNFGTEPVYMAFRKDAMLVAMGENGLATLKDAIAAAPKSAAPVQLDVRASKLAPIINKPKDAAARAAKTAFGSDPSADQIHFSVEGGEALSVRLNLKGAVLRFFHLTDHPQ